MAPAGLRRRRHDDANKTEREKREERAEREEREEREGRRREEEDFLYRVPRRRRMNGFNGKRERERERRWCLDEHASEEGGEEEGWLLAP